MVSGRDHQGGECEDQEEGLFEQELGCTDLGRRSEEGGHRRPFHFSHQDPGVSLVEDRGWDRFFIHAPFLECFRCFQLF